MSVEIVWVLNVLVLVVNGAIGVVVTMVLRRIDGVARDVKEIGEKVSEHAEALAEGRAQIQQLRRDVDGLLDREREHVRRVAAVVPR